MKHQMQCAHSSPFSPERSCSFEAEGGKTYASVESRVGLACAKVVLSAPQICRSFVPQLPRNSSTSPFSPDSGEKVADRPDEGAFRDGGVRENPPHPALSPKSIAAMLRHRVGCSHANDLGERGHFRTVRTAQIRDKEDLTKSNTFAQPRVGPASECERRPTNRSPANGGPARLSCRLSHPAKSLHNAL